MAGPQRSDIRGRCCRKWRHIAGSSVIQLLWCVWSVQSPEGLGETIRELAWAVHALCHDYVGVVLRLEARLASAEGLSAAQAWHVLSPLCRPMHAMAQL